MQTRTPSGFVIYRGPSQITGAPIVVVAITRSSNSKTGDMVQTYVLVDNGQSPVENARSLADAAVCGDCKHRRGMGGACYVNLGQGPRAVADGVVRGIYPADIGAAAAACAGRMVRLGTYGDPAAVPAPVWAALLAQAAGHTGYSHQWARGINPAVMQWCMASADTPAERAQAVAMGYRTFRVRLESDDLERGEFVCPASHEGGRRMLCADCGACSGGVGTSKASPAILAHGSLAGRYITIRAS